MIRTVSPVRQAVLGAAEHLFSELGYDQTSVQLIADAAGVPVEAVGREFGGKKQLYLGIMENVRVEGEKTLEKVVENYTPDAAGVHYLIDCAFDHFLLRPRHAGLWMQRRLQDAADLTEIEQRASGPQLTQVTALTRSAFLPGLDPGLVLQSLFWSMHDFVRGGIFDDTGGRMSFEDSEAVDRFRRHLHQMVSLCTGETG